MLGHGLPLADPVTLPALVLAQMIVMVCGTGVAAGVHIAVLFLTVTGMRAVTNGAAMRLLGVTHATVLNQRRPLGVGGDVGYRCVMFFVCHGLTFL
jgi:hypothetical protein